MKESNFSCNWSSSRYKNKKDNFINSSEPAKKDLMEFKKKIIIARNKNIIRDIERKRNLEITIIDKEELNSFADPNRASNGGGYHQPGYTFDNTSCGDFGTRYRVQLGAKIAYWGQMIELNNRYSDFCDYDDYWFINEFFNKFGIWIYSKQDMEMDNERYWSRCY